MINALHLVWIIPLCMSVGVFTTALFVGATCLSRESDAYHRGYEDGKIGLNNSKLVSTTSFKDWYAHNFSDDYEKFNSLTGGILYAVNETGQLYFTQVTDVIDLHKYDSWDVVDVQNNLHPVLKEHTA